MLEQIEHKNLPLVPQSWFFLYRNPMFNKSHTALDI